MGWKNYPGPGPPLKKWVKITILRLKQLERKLETKNCLYWFASCQEFPGLCQDLSSSGILSPFQFVFFKSIQVLQKSQIPFIPTKSDPCYVPPRPTKSFQVHFQVRPQSCQLDSLHLFCFKTLRNQKCLSRTLYFQSCFVEPRHFWPFATFWPPPRRCCCAVAVRAFDEFFNALSFPCSCCLLLLQSRVLYK
jgi:hypothetical protein